MSDQRLLIGSHAPFWHNGDSITKKNYNLILAALPAAIYGIWLYGVPALGVITLSIAVAMLWELIMNIIMKRPISIGDGSAAFIGLIFGMMLPATAPWWIVVVGTFIAIVVAKQIYGGIGCNPFNPALVAMAMLMLSWKGILNFNAALVDYDLGFNMVYPLSAIKHFGASAASNYDLHGLFMGKQAGAIGAVFGLGLLIGGIYMIIRGYIKWEISLSFLAGIYIAAYLFHIHNPERYAPPLFHILTGYTLLGAFFLAPEDSSSPVNLIPKLIYGAGAATLIILIRNIGAFVDGTVFAILMMNVANPLFDKIRPRAWGRGLENA
ncbi:MAG: electron transporter RnfD [Deltaproteobacteria bacterium]|nr:MAG: electron transporter RnfD [Deltaproteobacteria bacterium]